MEDRIAPIFDDRPHVEFQITQTIVCKATVFGVDVNDAMATFLQLTKLPTSSITGFTCARTNTTVEEKANTP